MFPLYRNWLIMVAVVRALTVLLLGQVLLGGAVGLIPEIDRRKYSDSGRHTPERTDINFLNEFELRLLNMFGLKRKPTPSKSAVVPQYMLDLYYMHSENDDPNIRRPRSTMGKHVERAASRANTIRSFHHEGEAWFDITAWKCTQFPSFQRMFVYSRNILRF